MNKKKRRGRNEKNEENGVTDYGGGYDFVVSGMRRRWIDTGDESGGTGGVQGLDNGGGQSGGDDCGTAGGGKDDDYIYQRLYRRRRSVYDQDCRCV